MQVGLHTGSLYKGVGRKAPCVRGHAHVGSLFKRLHHIENNPDTYLDSGRLLKIFWGQLTGFQTCQGYAL